MSEISTATPVRESLTLSSIFIDRPQHYSPGSNYAALTGWCDFAVDLSPKVASAKLVVQRFDENGRDTSVEIPMCEVRDAWPGWSVDFARIAAPKRWAISVQGMNPGDCYAYRLFDSSGNVIAGHVSDPFALASTPLSWQPAYLRQVREALEAFRRNGETDQELLKRVYSSGESSALASSNSLNFTPAHRDHFLAPWSVVVDKTRLLEPYMVALSHPHGAGERMIIKYHPWHSLKVPDTVISPEFKNKRGLIECLKDVRFTSYLQRFGNTIEFFPLGLSVSDPMLAALGRSNVWGYMPTHLCGLNPEYFASRDPHENIRTLQEVVHLLKQRGFSVICDLVSGHTAETGNAGPFFSLRHIYPEAYFLLDNEGLDVDVTGCRNTLNPASPLVVALLKHQSRFYVELLGVERRIDQAATLGIADESGEVFDPQHQTFQEIISMSSNPIVELMHGRGFYNRQIPDNRTSLRSKDFWLRNLQYALSFGETKMWPTSNPTAYRAFIASGSCGGEHPLQQQLPWSRNHGVQVFSHDGETAFDRARWMAVRLLNGKLPEDYEFKLLMQQIVDSSCEYDALYRQGQPRFKLMGQAIEHLQKNHPAKLEEVQGAAARWFLTQLYTTPGDILIVAGDQMRRTQHGNPDAYDFKEYLEDALLPVPYSMRANDERMVNNQIQSAFLTHRLRSMRDRFPAIFKNTSIVDGRQPSSSDPSVSLSLSWYNQNGMDMSENDWKGDPNGELYLAWAYTVHPIHSKDDQSPHTRLFFADTSRPCNLVLPDPGKGREWRVFVDSTRPLLLSSDIYKAGGSYYMPTCGEVVMESVLAESH